MSRYPVVWPTWPGSECLISPNLPSANTLCDSVSPNALLAAPRLVMLRIFDRFRRRPEQDAWCASAYLYEDTIIVHANNRTYNDFGWNSEPVATISRDSATSDIGVLIRSTVLASRWDAERPDPLGPDDPVLKAAGVKSWRPLEQKAVLIHFEMRDGTISIVPNRAPRRGEGQGWIAMDDSATLPDTCTDAELGDAAMRAFDDCIQWQPKL